MENGGELFAHEFFPVQQWTRMTEAVEIHLEALGVTADQPCDDGPDRAFVGERPEGNILAIGQDAAGVLLLELNGTHQGRVLRFSYREDVLFGRVAASLRDYAECCVHLARAGWWDATTPPGVPGRWFARDDAELAEFRTIAERYGSTLAIDGMNEPRPTEVATPHVPRSQELQLSMEQPTFSRAQSGRFDAYSSRPGWSA